MDHTKAISDHSPERYLLREMSPVETEEFERHYFECEECALAVESGEVFIANTRALLVDADSGANEKATPEAPRISLLASWTTWWTNPAFGLAAAAALVLGALALYERALLREHVIAGLAAGVGSRARFEADAERAIRAVRRGSHGGACRSGA